MRRAAHRRGRIYHNVRTAHLERAHQQLPATILYANRKYDFDPQLAAGLDLIGGSLPSRLGTVLRSDLEVLEVNEPLMPFGLADTCVSIATARAVAAVRRRPLVVGCYAIENRYPYVAADPSVSGARALRSKVASRAKIAMTRWIAARLDRIAFGTPAAAELYDASFPPGALPAVRVVIPALPAACECDDDNNNREPGRVLFVGRLTERKGIDRLLGAWPAVRASGAGTSLSVVGKGPLEQAVRDAAAADPGIDVLIDPPRPQIHRELRRAGVVVLLSQPTPIWREQVGLPIVEGLAHGCTVVTTDQTGLADWLRAHGHVVVATDSDTDAIARAVIAALQAQRPAKDVLDDLPGTDGRLAADAWLMGGTREGREPEARPDPREVVHP
ncbi:glycosyltransferase family 4 protein [uncultured Jatrophihabitans sp.]|uniref:glycosyltransferase family 4 protein n=1 Tax=uncultured Jatrophihabitans sp. TaxID=1610747 RepID=UPI0035CAFA80